MAHNGYIYNTQDRQDYCHVYLDGAEYPAYPNITVPLENENMLIYGIKCLMENIM